MLHTPPPPGSPRPEGTTTNRRSTASRRPWVGLSAIAMVPVLVIPMLAARSDSPSPDVTPKAVATGSSQAGGNGVAAAPSTNGSSQPTTGPGASAGASARTQSGTSRAPGRSPQPTAPADGGNGTTSRVVSAPVAVVAPKPTPRPSAKPTPKPVPPPVGQPIVPAAARQQVYIHYYLWWTPRHWAERLGNGYPMAAARLPLPATLDGTGCNPRSVYPGGRLTDVPTEGLYDQGNGATFDRHIADAVSARITGFLVSWQGTGQPGQSPSSSGYNARLDLLVARVNAFNASHGTRFRLALGLEAYGNYGRPASQVINDLEYFRLRYGNNPAFGNSYSTEPLTMFIASRQFSYSTVAAVSAVEKSRLFLVGDNTWISWARDAALFDGTGFYWSSQDPWQNPQSGSQVQMLAAKVRAAGKAFFAPFTPGYNTQMIGGSSCIPRRGVATLDAVWNLNRPSNPNGWFGVSWNEFVENSYLEPTLRYGRTYLNELARLIAAG